MSLLVLFAVHCCGHLDPTVVISSVAEDVAEDVVVDHLVGEVGHLVGQVVVLMVYLQFHHLPTPHYQTPHSHS